MNRLESASDSDKNQEKCLTVLWTGFFHKRINVTYYQQKLQPAQVQKKQNKTKKKKKQKKQKQQQKNGCTSFWLQGRSVRNEESQSFARNTRTSPFLYQILLKYFKPSRSQEVMKCKNFGFKIRSGEITRKKQNKTKKNKKQLFFLQ